MDTLIVSFTKTSLIFLAAVLTAQSYGATAPVSQNLDSNRPLSQHPAMTSTSTAGSAFHVSLAGDDAAAGTSLAPFKTIGRAREEVRKKVAAGLREPVRVVLRGGVYELSEPLTFGPEDSGSAAYAITYAAFPGETVVLSGGQRITNWKQDAAGRWSAALPDVKAGKWFFRQLVVNDRRATRARWPDEEGALRITGVEEGVTRFAFNRPLPEESLAGQDAEMVVYENWSITRGLVTSSGTQHLTTATAMGWIGHGAYTTASPGKPVYLEHARAFLDKPGEWFLDRAAGLLHYIPLEGQLPATAAAVAPRLERLLVLAGTKGKPVRNLHFEGIRFEDADFALPAIGLNEIQAAHYGTTTASPVSVQPVALECVYAEGCRFERCRFAHLNSSGIGFGPGCRSNAVVGCAIDDIGGNGVMVGWRGAGKLKPEGALDADWDDPSDAPAGNEVAHCDIQRCGADVRGGVGLFAAFSADTRLAHNVIHDMPYTGISIGFRWTSAPSSQMRCVVEYNHIFDVMKTLADGGGIYTLGFQPGTVLRGNHIHDVHRSANAHGGAPNNGFFIDEGSKAFLFESNVVHNTSGAPVRFNQNKHEWHEWKDNFLGDAAATSESAKVIIGTAGPMAGYSTPFP